MTMKAAAAFFVAFTIGALASIRVADAASIRSSHGGANKKQADRRLEINPVPWPPSYLTRYKQKYPDMNIQRCSAFLENKGIDDPPAEGTRCHKRVQVGNYACLVGSQTCGSSTETHPQKVCYCDITTGDLTCEIWEPCGTDGTTEATLAAQTVTDAVAVGPQPAAKKKWEKPSYWNEYETVFADKSFEPCGFLDKRGITDPQGGERCHKRKSGSYTCAVGTRECTARQKGLESTTHPRKTCLCDTDIGKLTSCEEWDPCDSTETTEVAGVVPLAQDESQPANEVETADELEAPVDELPVDEVEAPIDVLPVDEVDTEPADEDTAELVDCPSGMHVTTESTDDNTCKEMMYICLYPLVHWYQEGCGCGCQRSPDAVIHEACPAEKPEPGDLCEMEDECHYGETCCCGDCWQATTCKCEDNHFLCDTPLIPGCVHPCEPGGSCGGAEDKACEAGLQCVSSSANDCNPLIDADCMGVCVLDSCPKEEQGFTYVHDDIATCEEETYTCGANEEAWTSSLCGCGCKKTEQVTVDPVSVGVSLGHTECPEESNFAMSDIVCEVDLSCSWGEETCCGTTHSSFQCFCSANEPFACMYTDACMMPYCAGNCPAEAPAEGDSCLSSDFAGWWDWRTEKEGKCKFGDELACSCLIDGHTHEQECQCVDDVWKCETIICDDFCPVLVEFIADGTQGSYCGNGFPCNIGLECVDDPNDTCEPIDGAVECGGYCAPIEVDELVVIQPVAEVCPIEKPQLGDSCSVDHVCTYGEACGCGDNKLVTFECINGFFELSALALMVACMGPVCPEDDPNFPWFVEGQACTEGGGLGEDCHCSCGSPCGPYYWCDCTDEGTYSCRQRNNHNFMCACAAPPQFEYAISVDENGNVVGEVPTIPERGECPDAPPTPEEECNMPNERCGYDEVCGTNTTSYVCSQWTNKWSRAEIWIPDCPP